MKHTFYLFEVVQLPSLEPKDFSYKMLRSY